ncbi:MAG: hypothetical protein KGH58_02865 [Candidatus Micrarchaeota archaeon]|nr:hypothetical protein [Candidatus Micrarchaeota archaeon]
MQRAQSAMEYLMTYGWAILVIAVALAILYQLGVFGGGVNLLSTSCLASTGYLCTSPQLNTTGNLIVQFAQSTEQTITLTGIACTNGTTSPSGFQSITQTSLAPGQKTPLIFNCQLGSNTIGTKFSGSLWIQYNSQTQNGNTGRVGQVTAVASTTQPVSATTTIMPPQFSATCGGTLTVVNGNDICTFTSSGTFTVSGSGNVAVLVVGGGGAGGGSTGSYGGGGGAGGAIENDNFAVTAQAYTATVGAGGSGSTCSNSNNNGGNSQFSTITALGGGRGSCGGQDYCATSGGSGGGGAGGGCSGSCYGGASGTAGQGNGGGNGQCPTGGGGGGAGASGSNSLGLGGTGNGGAGVSSSISGSLTYYGGGGGGMSGSGGGAGGIGGGASIAPLNQPGNPGTPNTGGGGSGTNSGSGGAGGSGVVVIAYNALGNGSP